MPQLVRGRNEDCLINNIRVWHHATGNAKAQRFHLNQKLQRTTAAIRPSPRRTRCFHSRLLIGGQIKQRRQSPEWRWRRHRRRRRQQQRNFLPLNSTATTLSDISVSNSCRRVQVPIYSLRTQNQSCWVKDFRWCQCQVMQPAVAVHKLPEP